MFKFKSFIQTVYYQYIMSDKQRQQYYLEHITIPRVNLRIRACCNCSEEDAQLLIKEAQRISKVSIYSLDNIFNIIEYNLSMGISYNTMLIMLTMLEHRG